MQKLVVASIVILLLFAQSCYTKENATKKTERPPSIIYADNDTTVLGYFSKIGKKGPNLAPYFTASLKKDVSELLSIKDEKGNFMYSKEDGTPFDIYSDELKIYTTINPDLQMHAEAAIRRHMTEDLQLAFTKNNLEAKNFPFSDTYNGIKLSKKEIDHILNQSKRASSRFQNMLVEGISEREIYASFDVPIRMKLFSWSGEIDTILTPNDSILYNKNILRSSVISMEPSTGYVKAWVGGIDFDHFPFDNVRVGKRQMGSTIKPFVYSAAMSMDVIKPCTEFSELSNCIDPCDPSGQRWCPQGAITGNVKTGFAQSQGVISIAVMSKMGACNGPQTIAKLLEPMKITVPADKINPSICMGTPDVSLFELVATHGMFVNDGVFVSPQTVRRIEDRDGNVIYSMKHTSKMVLSPTVAFEMVQMMEGLVQFGMAMSLKSSAKWGGIQHAMAATIGNAKNNSHGWFIGMTPDLVTGVWVGSEDKQVRFRSMIWGQGARMALPIYGYYMQGVYADSNLKISREGFIPPNTYDPKRFECSESHN